MINTPTQTPSAPIAGVAGTVPPAPQPETIVVAPGPDYVWVGGAWLWMGNGWAWHRGYWHRPVYPQRHGYRFRRRW
jgi:hypothetical protein